MLMDELVRSFAEREDGGLTLIAVLEELIVRVYVAMSLASDWSLLLLTKEPLCQEWMGTRTDENRVESGADSPLN